MIKLLTIIGARPQIIKASALSRAIRTDFLDKIVEKILHTGQHYDANMSQVFFQELGIPQPDYHLNVGSGKHGEQTAKMITGIEAVLTGEPFDGVVLYGDTNSTLAGAVAAAKMNVPIFHVEAGLRSFNMSMPEELNRIVCDQLSSILFAPTQTAVCNLEREGFTDSLAVFKGNRVREICFSGDVMYDNSMFFSAIADQRSNVLQRYGLHPGEYVLTTIHRDNNTDCPKRLTDIFRALLQIAREADIKIVLPLHPRTAKLLDKNVELQVLMELKQTNLILFIPPVSFLDMISLEKNAKIVMTDSGGVQKEAFFFEKPCVILRPETEWVEIVEHHAGIIADANFDRIVVAFRALSENKIAFPMLFGDANAAGNILQRIVSYLS